MGQTTDTSTASVTRQLWNLLPGLAVTVAVATASISLQRIASQLGVRVLSSVFLAIVVGVALRGAIGERPSLVPGVRLAGRGVLKVAIVLLGLRFAVTQVWQTGATAVLAVTTVVLVAFGAVALLSRLSTIDRRLGLLIGVGTAICGNSAIAATAPLLGATDEDISFASATITLFGMIAMAVYPLIGYAAEMSDVQFGVFAGAGVHDSAQAIASGFVYSSAAGGAATIVKLTRTAFLIPTVLVLGWCRRCDGDSQGLAGAIPWFVFGFIGLAGLRSFGDAVLHIFPVWHLAVKGVSGMASFLLVAAMAAVGFQTDLQKLRSIGRQPFYVGFAAAVTVGVVAFAFAMTI